MGKDPGAVAIRVARPDEYPLVGDIVVGAYRSVGSSDEGYEAYMRDVAARAETSVVLVAEVAGRVVGSVTFVAPGAPLAEVDDPDAATIRMLGVDPAARGRGVGEALVRACLTRAAEGGAERVRLHTEPFMASARRLYERLGFVRDTVHDFEPVPGVALIAYVLPL